MEDLPEEYLKRDCYICLYKGVAAHILQMQDAQGSWHANLLDAGTYPQPENSTFASACCGLAWGVRNGILDAKTYKGPIIRAQEALCSYTHKDGKVGYIQPVGNAPTRAGFDSTDVCGVGAFLPAASEMFKMP